MKWISVDSRLPELVARVLLVDETGYMEVGSLLWVGDSEVRWYGPAYKFIPTHWMPLPEKPE